MADLLGQMTLPEKIGQMTQIETNSIKDNNLITQKFLGSVLSGGDGQPKPNTLDNWVKMVSGYQKAEASGSVLYNRFGDFKDLPSGALADVGVVVVGEQTYAEGVGDRADLSLSSTDSDLVNKVRPLVKKLVVILVSGRPMIINDALKSADAFVAAWLPGTEGQGVADVLFGDQPFTGKLPFTWPKSMDQLPFNLSSPAAGAKAPLFPFGYGLTK